MKIPATSSDEVTQVKLNLYKRASLLALITIFYNLIEGFVSVFLVRRMKRFLYWVLELIPLSRSFPVLVFGIWFGELDTI